MDKIIIKDSVKITKKNGINFLLDNSNRPIKNKPWLGDLFSFLYDWIMEKSVFPKKFNSSIEEHYKILGEIFENVSDKVIIEFASGSGDAIKFLNKRNSYAGVDISSGLLRLAKKKFDQYGFKIVELYCADACETPFQDNTFDIAVCNLSLNFFQSIDKFLSELQRILKPNGIFYCSVPIPERKKSKAIIHGTLYTLDDLKVLFENRNFDFEPFPHENGTLLYFKAKLNANNDEK
ncbi:class I SAM-dependent methyltransferase [Gaoshiqia sediminis]|uniref:Class I SAM-dependent methyltransferase n=1 Tax=Gaoshiqia sediminis TaxID=2986998 RepID=A0AA41Y9B6_9BACT|nr:class I SAM-dependent methyltransferase [Gaoshiqia sediminis]MCW0481793.1 class I SAM-dependent methyltransferase [Gaoshiqia sediminis]